ncbi:AGC/AKT protein kinase [Aphelenchoides fujianensis]|nr:AGC/AKT protein kinase [Aphelenchoides fujianensis]
MTSTKRKHSFLGWTTSSFANLANSFTNAAQSSSSNAAGAANPPAKITTSASNVVHHGWVQKRGEHIKNWRPRYFVLFSDGALLGYKSKVEQSFNDPLNVFTVKDVQTMRVDRPRPFTFLLRGLQHTTIVERMFCTESDRECAAWLEAIRNVSESLKYEAMEQDSISVSQLPVDFGEVESGDEDRISRTTVADAGAQQMEIQYYDAPIDPSALHSVNGQMKEVLINKDEVEHTYTENRLYYHLNGEVRRHNRPFSEERTRLCKEDITYQDRCSTFCGTPEYLAPEVIEDGDYSRAVDFWSLGIVTYEMISGRLPFFSRDHEKLFELILNGNPRFPTRATAEARALLSGLLIKDPTQRLGGGVRDALEIMEHPFFSVLDWDKVYRKEYVPQFRPELQGEDDTIYFDQEFTHEPVQLTPPPSRNGHVEGVDDLLNAKFTHFKFQDTYPVSNANGVPPAIPEEQEVAGPSAAAPVANDVEMQDEEADDGLQMRSGRP